MPHLTHLVAIIIIAHTCVVWAAGVAGSIAIGLAFGGDVSLVYFFAPHLPGLIGGFAWVSLYSRKQSYPHALFVMAALWSVNLAVLWATSAVEFRGSPLAFAAGRAFVVVVAVGAGHFFAFLTHPPHGASRARYLARRLPIVALLLILILGQRFFLVVPAGMIGAPVSAANEPPVVFVPGLHFPVHPNTDYVTFDPADIGYAEAVERFFREGRSRRITTP